MWEKFRMESNLYKNFVFLALDSVWMEPVEKREPFSGPPVKNLINFFKK